MSKQNKSRQLNIKTKKENDNTSIFHATSVLSRTLKNYIKKVGEDTKVDMDFEKKTPIDTFPTLKEFKKGPQFFHVKNSHSPPPLLEGQACLYILGLGRNEDESANAHVSQNIDLFYVGESEGIRQRLQQHRRTFKSKDYDYLEAIIVPVYDKSLAKTLESLVIQNFKKASIPLIADKDGSRHVGMRSKF